MNVYKLKEEEILKMHNEFNKTSFGKRAKLFSMVPLVGLVVTLLVFAIEIALESDIYLLFLCLSGINLALFGIAQLQYGNMLKDYVQSKKDKE